MLLGGVNVTSEFAQLEFSLVFFTLQKAKEMQVETFIIILIAFLLGFRVILRYLYVHNGLQICMKSQ